MGAHDAFHNAEGNVKVVSLTEGSKILRLENFKSTNGPNVHVYLSTDKHATDYVDLGRQSKLQYTRWNGYWKTQHRFDMV
jgi:hypothetical protein